MNILVAIYESGPRKVTKIEFKYEYNIHVMQLGLAPIGSDIGNCIKLDPTGSNGI